VDAAFGRRQPHFGGDGKDRVQQHPHVGEGDHLDPFDRRQRGDGGAQGAEVAAVRGQENNPTEPVLRQRPHDLAGDRLERPLVHGERPRERHVVARKADAHRRRQEGVQPLRHRQADLVAEDGVRPQREVRTVLLHRPERHDHCRPAPRYLLADLGPGHPLQVQRPHASLLNENSVRHRRTLF